VAVAVRLAEGAQREKASRLESSFEFVVSFRDGPVCAKLPRLATYLHRYPVHWRRTSKRVRLAVVEEVVLVDVSGAVNNSVLEHRLLVVAVDHDSGPLGPL